MYRATASSGCSNVLRLAQIIHDLREALGAQREDVRLPLEDPIADRILQIESHLALEVGIEAIEPCPEHRNDFRVPQGPLGLLQQLQYGVHEVAHEALLLWLAVQLVGGTTSRGHGGAVARTNASTQVHRFVFQPKFCWAFVPKTKNKTRQNENEIVLWRQLWQGWPDSAHGQLIKTERGASQRGGERREGVEQTATGREAAVQFELE